ncbi:uncharacterized protein BP01DRAFT_100964 [Aspergillus saccharolyticus JOP 1030-1]|uniref:Uncharacterized protein n=1 Tax=Aspergillus saccharolyticus JOP 1030-1 TaxID=1450539 RepID=A0A318Z8A3_9EURO|nr:hypothetical protein BP01DRAFT_100964 [Aspergillus saccharolyticus JOP 1030-1]PYH43555.1 hypothetical protein BP01DRAFT_100964 [Aspergillus saccharolyticus JOP 1030-1]
MCLVSLWLGGWPGESVSSTSSSSAAISHQHLSISASSSPGVLRLLPAFISGVVTQSCIGMHPINAGRGVRQAERFSFVLMVVSCLEVAYKDNSSI